jgi:hypothetical protein
MREILIEAIIDLSADEFESKDDIIEIAKETETQLVERLIGIACFYRDQLNDVSDLL